MPATATNLSSRVRPFCPKPRTALWNPDGNLWHIGLHTTDDALSRILNMFDGISFNPQVHAVARFGLYAESPFAARVETDSRTYRFSWGGEPHDSAVATMRSAVFARREGLFYTGVNDGETWQRRFGGGFGEINEFARSNEGHRLTLPPTRADGEYAAVRAEVEAQRWDLLHALSRTFLLEALDLHASVRVVLNPIFFPTPWLIDNPHDINHSEIWTEYMNALNAHGLQDLIALYAQLPLR